MHTHIERIRSFNRTVTRRIGVLQDRFLGRDRPLGESRLLFEIGTGGMEVRALRVKFGLDSGYVSRLLRSLERQKMIETGAAPHDGRVRYIKLTRLGLLEREEIDRRSDEAAETILAPLGKQHRARLVAAMADVERLLIASEITITPEPAGSGTAQWCLSQYFEVLNARFEGGYNPDTANPADPQDLSPPSGIFLVARAQEEPVGCGALKSSGPGIGEIKRLWAARSVRGLGIGQRLLNALESQARDFGMKLLRLDTNRSLTEARALYLKNGYREVPPFNDDPYPHHWFEKPLN